MQVLLQTQALHQRPKSLRAGLPVQSKSRAGFLHGFFYGNTIGYVHDDKLRTGDQQS